MSVRITKNELATGTAVFSGLDLLQAELPDHLITSETVDLSQITRAGAHQVYNFEVAGTHTYIADGFRVHNTSVLAHLTDHELANIESVTDSDGDGDLDFAVSVHKDARGYVVGKTNHKVVTKDGKSYLEGHQTFTDEHGRLMQLQYTRDPESGETVEMAYELTGAAFGEGLGTLLTPYMTAAIIGDDANVFQKIVADTIVGTLVENIFEFAGGNLHSILANWGQGDHHSSGDVAAISDYTFRDIVDDFGSNAVKYTSQHLTNWIMAEVFEGISTKTVAGETFKTLASRGVGFIVDEGLFVLAKDVLGLSNESLSKFFDIKYDAATDVLDKASLGSKIGDMFTPAALGGLLMSTAFSRILPKIETVEGMIASGAVQLALRTFDVFKSIASIGSSSSPLFGLVGFNPVIMVIGVLVGKLFDSLFEKVPQAYTNVKFDKETGRFVVGNSWSDDGGNKEFGKRMAGHYVDFMNGFLDQSQSQSNNAEELADTMKLVFGHYEELIVNGSGRTFATLDVAIQARIIDTMQEFETLDGDLKVRDSITEIKQMADVVDDISHAGSYTYWKKFFFFKIKKKTVYVSMNDNPESDTAELVEVVRKSNFSSSDIVGDVVRQANALFGDINVSGLQDNAGFKKIINRMFTRSYAHNTALMNKVADIIYIRGLAANLDKQGYTFKSKAQMMQALRRSGLTISTDQELYSQLNHNTQIAAEYQAYLENQVAYNAAIQAAGPDSAYAQGWALTFLEASRLGITGDYVETGDAIDNVFVTSSGNDSIDGGLGNDTIKTYSGDDILRGGNGHDTLFGGLGDDVLMGGNGNDVMHAGAGLNTAHGGYGNDTYRIGNFGEVSIRESRGYGQDTVQFLGLRHDEVTLSYEGNSLVLSWDEGKVSIGDRGRGIETYEFVNGTVTDIADIGNADKQISRLYGTSGDDVIVGSVGRDYIYGGAGNDDLRAGENGAGGWQYLYGGKGDDTYRYSKGDGSVYISSSAEVRKSTWARLFSKEGRKDKIVFDDLSMNDVTFDYTDYTKTRWTAEGHALRILWTKDGESGELRIANMAREIESIEFADGSIVSRVEGEYLARHSNKYIHRSDDYIHGSSKDDTILGSAGTDRIYAGAGDDIISAGKGTGAWQYLYGQAGDDIYRYSKESKNVYVSASAETAKSGEEDTFYFTDLDLGDVTFDYYDYTHGGTRASSEGVALNINWTKDGESGQLRVANMGKHIEKFAFADGSVVSRVNADWLKRYNPKIYGNRPDDELFGSDGGDVILGSADRDRVYGGLGDDILGAGGNIRGGWQYLYGREGNDTYRYSSGDGHVYISAWAEAGNTGKSDRIILTDLDMGDVKFSYHNYGAKSTEGNALRITWSKDGKSGELRVANMAKNIETISFADGSSVSTIDADWLKRYHSSYAAYGDDKLVGTSGDDMILGSAGRDRVHGGDGNDTIGAGKNDAGGWQYLYGQKGDDTYVVGSEDGHVYIANSAEHDGAGMGTADRVEFTDLELSDISISNYDYGNAEGNSLRLLWNKDGKRGELRIANMGKAIESFIFADGSTLSGIQARNTGSAGARHQLMGTEASDVLTGSSGVAVFGRGGFDTLDGRGGVDVLHGGNGNDVLTGKGNRDYLYGGANEDTLFGGSGHDHLNGGTGDDVLHGGTGNDRMLGGGGDDTYQFNKGDGVDTIDDTYVAKNPFWQPYTVRVLRGGKRRRWVNETRHRVAHTTAEENGGNDKLVFGAGINMDDVSFTTTGSTLRVAMPEAANLRHAPSTASDQVLIEHWANAKRAVETVEFTDGVSLNLAGLKVARSGNDLGNKVVGTGYGDLLAGMNGNDAMYGGGGDDVMLGGRGDDYMVAGNDDDDLYGSSGHDRMYGQNGNDYLTGGEGNDKLYGGNGDDVMIGGTGADLMQGGRGNDTYFMQRGSGHDVINETAFEQVKVAVHTTVKVQKDVAQYKTVPVYKTYSVGKSTVTRQTGTKKVFTGTKRMWVNETRTSYKTQTRAVEGGKDTLQFKGDIKISDLIVNRTGSDLSVQLSPEAAATVSDSVTIKNWNYRQFRVETFAFENGYGLEVGRINYARTGGHGNDYLTANGARAAGSELVTGKNGAREAWLAGGEGHDKLVGSRYSDILIGGKGNDTLWGGDGDDVYVFGLGDGHDIISDGGSNAGGRDDLRLLNGEVFGDKIVLGVGLSVENIVLQRVGNDLKILLHADGAANAEDPLTSSDSLTVRNWHVGSRRIETLQFVDGTDLDISKVGYVWNGTANGENGRGNNSGNWMDGGAGDDNVMGFGGDDYLFGRAGADLLAGGDGHDFLSGGAGDDLLTGDAGQDFIAGGAGADYLQGGTGDDVLVGGEGADVLVDGTGDDVVIGGEGADSYRNGAGADIIRFGYGDNMDTYHFEGETASKDVVLLEGNMDRNAVWFSREGRDLVMQLLGSNDGITFRDWYVNDTSATTSHTISAFVLGEEILTNSKIAGLVNAMAAFDPNDGILGQGAQASKLPDVVQLAVNSAWKAS